MYDKRTSLKLRGFNKLYRTLLLPIIKAFVRGEIGS
jgi:hypothetical protein